MIIWKQQAVIKYVEKVREKLSGISIQEEHVQNWFWEGFFPLPKKLQFVCSTSIPGTLYIPIWKRNEALLKWMPNHKTKVNEIFNGISLVGRGYVREPVWNSFQMGERHAGLVISFNLVKIICRSLIICVDPDIINFTVQLKIGGKRDPKKLYIHCIYIYIYGLILQFTLLLTPMVSHPGRELVNIHNTLHQPWNPHSHNHYMYLGVAR